MRDCRDSVIRVTGGETRERRLTGWDECDSAFWAATEVTARILSEDGIAGSKLGELSHLTPTFKDALAITLGSPVDREGLTLPLPNWEPRPGHVDVAIHPQGRSTRCVAELKMHKTDETLWDLYKMIDALDLPEIGAAYLVVGASRAQWEKQTDACTEIFNDSGLDAYPTWELFEKNKRAWWNLLHGGPGRPASVPASINVTSIAKEDLTTEGKPGWLKCVRVAASGSERIQFQDDWYHGNWPLGIEPGPDYFATPPPKGARGLPLAEFPPVPRAATTLRDDSDYLASAATLPQRGLEDLGYVLSDGGDDDQGVDTWNFILDGPRVFVTSSSGMYLRCHIHHIAIGESLPQDGTDSSLVFVACRRIKVYADFGRTGWLDAFYRGPDLESAISASNREFKSWLFGDHGIDRQPEGQREIARADFDAAFAAHPGRPGESDVIADSLAYEILGEQPPTGAVPTGVLRLSPFYWPER